LDTDDFTLFCVYLWLPGKSVNLNSQRQEGREDYGLISILPAIISALICSSSALTEALISVLSLGNINVPWASNGKPAQAEASELVAPHGGAAETARLNVIAGEKYNLYGSTAGTRAPKLTRVQIADAARLSAIAGEQCNLYGSTAWTRNPYPLSRVQLAEAARLNAIAGGQYNLYGSTVWTRYPYSLSQTQKAEAARLTALAIHYGKPPASISPSVASLIP
jgi:hypothetical protein